MTDCKKPVGVEDGTITNQQMTASSSHEQFDAFNGRLNNKLGWGGWCPVKSDLHQFLQVIMVKNYPLSFQFSLRLISKTNRLVFCYCE